MKSEDFFQVEYFSILKRAGREAWLAELLAAHATPCTQQQALGLLKTIDGLPRLRLRWGNRGRARYRLGRGFGMTLPQRSGAQAQRLRVGVILHESAHLLDRVRNGKFSHHQEPFLDQLRALVQIKWRKVVPTSSYAQIYARHAGPYGVSITREIDHGGKKGKEHVSAKLEDRFTAEEAHEECRVLVNDPKDNVIAAYVFSESEGQFTGACYQRGETYRPWREELDADRQPEPEATPAAEPVAPATDWKEIGKAVKPAKAAKVVKPVDKVPTPRKPSVPLTVAAGRDDSWPPSAPAQAVKAALTAKPMTAKEAAEALAAKMTELGVAHPASLISRLKQAGLLVEQEAA